MNRKNVILWSCIIATLFACTALSGCALEKNQKKNEVDEETRLCRAFGGFSMGASVAVKNRQR